jgi:hypothetical protein
MTADRCREWRERLGAYVLRQLPDDEMAATSAHLDGCAACRAEAASLAPLSALLDRADPSTLSSEPTPPPHLADAIDRRIAAEQRNLRRRRHARFGLTLSGATVAAAAAVVAFALVPGGSQTAQEPTSVAFRSLPPRIHLAATLASRPWGTEVRMHVRGIRPGTLCRVWLRGPGGARVPAGSFRYRYEGESESDAAVLTSALPASSATAVGVEAGRRTFVAPVTPPDST